MGRDALAIATESRHGPELILGYLDAAWADCAVSVESGATHLRACKLLPRLQPLLTHSRREGEECAMAKQDDYEVGYGRPPKSSQFKKGQSGYSGGRRKKSGPIKVNTLGILDEVFPVQCGGQVRHMSAKEIALRRILKKAIEGKHFSSMAYLLELFDKHGCTEQPQTSGVITLPTNSMPSRMCLLIFAKFKLPPQDWKKRHIAWGRKQYEATKTELERELEAAGVMP